LRFENDAAETEAGLIGLHQFNDSAMNTGPILLDLGQFCVLKVSGRKTGVVPTIGVADALRELEYLV